MGRKSEGGQLNDLSAFEAFLTKFLPSFKDEQEYTKKHDTEEMGRYSKQEIKAVKIGTRM